MTTVMSKNYIGLGSQIELEIPPADYSDREFELNYAQNNGEQCYTDFVYFV